MDSNIVTVVPGQDTSISDISPSGKPYSSPTDSQGREKRRLFVRRMNSAAIALFSDILINTIVSVVLVIVLLFASGAIALFNLQSIMDDPSSGMEEMLNSVVALAGIAAAVASLCGHIIPAYMHSARCNFSLASTMKRGSKLGGTLPAAIVVALGVTYAWVFIYAICGDLLPDSFFANRNVFGNAFASYDLTSMIIMGVSTGILIPIAEEILFRGALLKSFSKYGTGFAVFASSFLFGLMHGNLFQTPFATLGGVVLAYVAVRSGSLWPSIIIHMSINSYSVLRDMLMTLLPGYSDELQFLFAGISGLFILGTIIILCAGARRISWTPIDRASNNILLPEVRTKVRLKVLRFVLSFGILLFVIIYGIALLADGGFFGLGEDLGELAGSSEEYSEMLENLMEEYSYNFN